MKVISMLGVAMTYKEKDMGPLPSAANALQDQPPQLQDLPLPAEFPNQVAVHTQQQPLKRPWLLGLVALVG
jgi:hypothetical protein